jgi:hypothetical protein
MSAPVSLIGTLKTEIFPFSIITHFGDYQGEVVHEALDQLYCNGGCPVTLSECISKAEEVNEKGLGHVWHVAPHTVVLWVGSVNDYSVIAHEIFHAAYWLLSNQGIQLTPETNEVYAYLIGWMTEEIHKGIDGCQVTGAS